jgi:hypothetical protein
MMTLPKKLFTNSMLLKYGGNPIEATTHSNEPMTYNEMCEVIGTRFQSGINSLDKDNFVFYSCHNTSKTYGDYDAGDVTYYTGQDQMNSRHDKKDQLYSRANAKVMNRIYQYITGEEDSAPVVQLWEKLARNNWSFRGDFDAVGFERTHDGDRYLYHFKLIPQEWVNTSTGEVLSHQEAKNIQLKEAIVKGLKIQRKHGDMISKAQNQLRRIPSAVKTFVFKRDNGKCVSCSSNIDICYDHILPFAKGGTSSNPDNIQLLCNTCNSEKSDDIGWIPHNERIHTCLEKA